MFTSTPVEEFSVALETEPLRKLVVKMKFFNPGSTMRQVDPDPVAVADPVPGGLLGKEISEGTPVDAML